MPARLRASFIVIVTMICLAPVRALAACPDCAPIGAARAAIRDDPSFWTYVSLTALPFIIVALIAAAAHRVGRPPRPARNTVGEVARS